ncbi:RIT1 tRNA A64-2'-O-ribosylphosphate transferase [Candida maltosa Xu316]
MEPIFNSNNDINVINKDLKKSSLSLKNRLQSILYDYYFVSNIQDELNYPLVPNERCGLWYVPTNERLDSCYFKSTDGHTNVWSFSLRRLNLHLLPHIISEEGIIIVDSTRRGKLMPDALSKTIPIWCAVLNCILYKEGDWLKTPSVMVSENEHNSIKKLIPSFVETAKQMKLLDGYKLDKPLVPSWYYPGSAKPEKLDDSVYNICCVSASKKVDVHKQLHIQTRSGLVSCDYVQGAADDHELWVPKDLCNGDFNANTFWSLADTILVDGYITLNDSELEQKINQCYKPTHKLVQTFKLGETDIYVGKLESDIDYKDLDTDNVIVFHETYNVINIPENKTVQSFPIMSNKKGANALRAVLPKIDISLPITILCDTGTDMCIGMALVVLCRKYDLDWNRTDTPPPITKTLIKQHLSKVSQSCKANPSRSTLQSVNSFLFKG